MENIQFFLEKFKKIEVPNSDLIKALQSTILKNTGIDVPKNKINIQRNQIFIQVSPIEKSEIILKKPLIIKDLEDGLLGKFPQEIR